MKCTCLPWMCFNLRDDSASRESNGNAVMHPLQEERLETHPIQAD